MRLPLVPSLSTKDGVSNKNARLTNCLKETSKSGEMAVVRPGLVSRAITTGDGIGIVSFNDHLLSVYGSYLQTISPETFVESIFQSTGLDVPVASYAAGALGYVITGSIAVSEALFSQNGSDWEYVTLPISGESWTVGAASPTRFVMLSDGTGGAYSDDGVNWTSTNAHAYLDSAAHLCYGNGVWIAVGQSAQALRSVDGISWSTVSLPSLQNWSAVVWTGSNFCAVSDSAVAATSPDGITWTSRTMPSSSLWRGIASNGIRTVATTASFQNKSAVSLDHGVTWQEYAMTALPYGGQSAPRLIYVNGDHFCSGAGYFLRNSFDGGVTWQNDLYIPEDDSTGWLAIMSTGAGEVIVANTGVDFCVRGIYFGVKQTITATLSGDFFDFAQSTL